MPFTLYEGLKKAILRSWPDMLYTCILKLTKPCNHISPQSLEFWLRIKRVPDLFLNALMIYQIIGQFVNFSRKLNLVYKPHLIGKKFIKTSCIQLRTLDCIIWFAFRIIHRIIDTKLYLNIKLKTLLYLFTWASIYYPFIFSLSICCKNLVMSVLLDFTKDREKNSIW